MYLLQSSNFLIIFSDDNLRLELEGWVRVDV